MDRVQLWERRAEVPLLLLALAFLVAYVWPVLDPGLDATTRTWLTAVSWTVWFAFAVDFVIRMALVDDGRATYALHHWYDVALILLPLLRPLRLLRVLAFVRILDRSAADSFAGRALVYVGGAATVLCGLSAVAILDAERGATNANIHTIGDALWWSATTVTTVGYGDRFPVTGSGRIIAVALMLVGIGVVGTVTASVASWIIERNAAPRPTE